MASSRLRLLIWLVLVGVVGGVIGYRYAISVNKSKPEIVAANKASGLVQESECAADLLQIDKSKETIGNDLEAAKLLQQYCLWAVDYQTHDFTGDGQEERALIGVGAGCTSCHAKTLIVFNDEKELFREEYDDLIFRKLDKGNDGFIAVHPISLVQEASCCPTSGILTEYRYRQGDGFYASREEVVPFK